MKWIIPNLKIPLSFILFATLLTLPQFSYAQASEGGVTTTQDTFTVESVVDVLSPFQATTLQGDYTASGVGLRGKTSGSITISDIPSDSSIEKAYLYWSFLDDGFVLDEQNVLFNGSSITGTEIGSGPDTCWGRQNSRAFRAEVTSFVDGNGVYTISDVAQTAPILAQGASLVIIYNNSALEERTILINDGNGVIDTATINLSTSINGFTAAQPSAGDFSAKTTFIVGDGQSFTDTVSFNGGDGTFTANNTLDGSDGNLWDTDAYDVSSFVAPGDTSASATISRGEDCLNWVAQVFSVTTGGEEEQIRTQAAELTKELLNSDYLYGGKGWDYNISEFVAPDTIKTGYNFWNQSAETPSIDFDAGVDCSGLVMWSYNRSFDPTKSRFNNFVKAEGADEQFRENTEQITEAQLAPGDVLFSDFEQDGFIDHVAVYVGESGGFDVVSAVNETIGIIGTSKDILKQPERGFVAFKRVVSANPISTLIQAGSPVDLTVTDPDDFTITPETIIPSDLEFLRQIPGELYYSEIEQSPGGRPADQVYSYKTKEGDYLIQVTPEPDASPTDTYDLAFTINQATTTVLAENVPISDVPGQPYIVRTSEEGAEKIIPAKVKITPKTLNLGQKGLFTTTIEIEKGFGASVADMDTESIKIEDASADRVIVVKDKFAIALFKAQDLENVDTGKDIELKFTGQLNDGTKFEGQDSIRTISQGRFSTVFNRFNRLANVLASLQSLLSQFSGLLQL